MGIELVSGEPPFCHLNDIECLFKMSEKNPPPIPGDVTGKCRDFLVKCLDPEWRTVLSKPLCLMLMFSETNNNRTA